MREDNRAVDEHPGEVDVDASRKPSRTIIMGRWGEQPPGSIGGPDGGKDVIEPDTAAPIEAEKGFGLAGGFADGYFVTPVISDVERGDDVGEIEHAAG